MDNEIVKIVLTGGPCGGKSSAEAFLKKELKDRGFYPMFVQESATRIINQYGINPPKLRVDDPAKYFEFQSLIIKTQRQAEEAAIQNSEKFADGKRIVMICDRGIPDSAAFMTMEEYGQALRLVGLNRTLARDARYESIFHLVTAADGAENHYTLKNNEARYENSLDLAKDSDQRAQIAWLGHTHQRIIDNSTDFEGKKRRLITKVLRSIGIPEKYETERKYLMHTRPDITSFPVPVQPLEIYQTYLKKDADGHRHRLRWREQAGEGIVYYETFKIGTESAASSIENEKIITSREYFRLLQNRDPDREEIYKTRHYFIWKNQVFELDFFHLPSRLAGLTLLEIELDDENDKVELLDWLGPITEVTEDPNYKNSNLAKRP